MQPSPAHTATAAGSPRPKYLEQPTSRGLNDRRLKLPSGEPISAAFLSTVLPCGVIAPVVGFRVDEDSVIEGRHSTTFRLLLDRQWRQPPARDGGREEEPRADGDDVVAAAQLAHMSVFVKRMICKELPPRSLSKWRTSIASYRAEATFVKKLSSAKTLDGIAPDTFWVHVDDRLGYYPYAPPSLPLPPGGRGEGSAVEAAGGAGEMMESCFMMITEDLGAEPAIICSSETSGGIFSPGDASAKRHDGRIRTEASSWEQVGAVDLERAKLALSSAARLHASFWANLSPPPSQTANRIGEQSSNRNGTPTSASEPTVSVSADTAMHQSVGNPSVGVSTGKEGVGGGSGEAHVGATAMETQATAAAPAPAAMEVKERQGSDPRVRVEENDARPQSGGIHGTRVGGRYARGLHEQGTFWSLEKRDPGDLPGLEEEYGKLLRRFRTLLPGAWFEEEQENGGSGSGPSRGREAALGRRLTARARELDAAAHDSEVTAAAQGEGSGGRAEWEKRGSGRGRTLVHGDLKTWNVFFSKDRAEATATIAGAAAARGSNDAPPPSPTARSGRVKFIDWQWCGEGLAATDVAYMICTSVEVSALNSERDLLEHYHAELVAGLENRVRSPGNPEAAATRAGSDSPSPCDASASITFAGARRAEALEGRVEESGADVQPPGLGASLAENGARATSAGGEVAVSPLYPWEQFVDDYRVAFLDYMRCVVGTLWKGLSPEKLEKNRATGPGMSLINRSLDHVRWMIEKATRLLDELDELEGDKCRT